MLSFKTLLNHQWLEVRRSTFWQKSLAINIVISILLLYVALNLIALGWFIDIILADLFPETDIVLKFTELLFYYFTLDLFGRFVLQNMPILSINPYLHLPIKREKLFDYMLLRSLFNFFNLIPLFLILPFFIKVVASQLQAEGIAWLVGILLVILSNNYLTFFLKKLFSVKPAVSLVLLALVGLLFYLDFSDRIAISKFFGRSFFVMVNNPIILLVPGSIAIVSYLIDKRLMGKYIYSESQAKDLSSGYTLSDSFSFLGKLGVIGSLIMLEIRLIFRNARPRTLAIMSAVMMLYGLIMYPSGIEVGYGFLLFPAFFVMGLFMLSHGQLILAWDSMHFDFLLVNNLSPFEILTSKYRLFLGANTLFFIVTLPYGLYANVIFFINACMYLFNTGVTVYFLLIIGVHSTKRVDLTKGAFFNYEGFSGMTYLGIIPALALPFLLLWPFSALGNPLVGIGLIGVLGILGIAANKTIIKKLAERLSKRKYIMSSGYRSS